MGDALRRIGVAADARPAEAAWVCAASVEAIARLREELGPVPVEPGLARRVAGHFAVIRAAGAESRDLPLAEIGLSGELLFDALARRPGVLGVAELHFLDNVIAVLRELGGSSGEPRGPEVPDLMADAFDRLLARFETA
jgi:hypothetical protein